MTQVKRLVVVCVSFLLVGHSAHAAEPDPDAIKWWAKHVPSSGFVPADENLKKEITETIAKIKL